jgi:general stress protein 26
MKAYFRLTSEAAKLFLFCITILFISALSNIKAQETANRDSVISAAKEIISHVTYCGLITVDSTGTANVRTMNPFPPEEDMCVWMATNKHTRKYFEIKENPRVTLYYANHAAAEGYVTIIGKAVLVDDMAEKQKRKREYWTQAFPDFNNLILIKIVPEKLEVVNYKHNLYGAEVTWQAPFIKFEKEK